MDDLTVLGKKYGTGKIRWNYLRDLYYPLFRPHRKKNISLLEIGAGDTGASHKMWREYFSNAEIYCLDPFCLPKQVVTVSELEELGIHVCRGNQLSREDLRRTGAMAVDGYDFIIDDGAHLPDALQLSLATLFPYLKEGGIFIIEDIATHRRRGTLEGIKKANQSLEVCTHRRRCWGPHDGRKDMEKFMSLRHQLEMTLDESFQHFEKTGKWLANLLTGEEQQYLEENIQDDVAGIFGNVCVIKKKNRKMKNG